MEEHIIEKALDYVRVFFAGDSGGHDDYHTLRVWKTARTILQSEPADSFLVEMAALLHDVDDEKLSPETCQRKDNARNFLRENGMDNARIEAIVRIISQISFAGNGDSRPDTMEGKIVQDADRLDAMGAVGIARTFAYGGKAGQAMYDPEIPPRQGMSRAEYRMGKSTSLNHFYEKLLRLKGLMNTDTGRRMAEERHRFMEGFVEEFLMEWNGNE